MVSSQDLEAVAEPVLSHRIITNFHARSQGITSSKVIQRLIQELLNEHK
jgi:MoxR-like ATPase